MRKKYSRPELDDSKMKNEKKKKSRTKKKNAHFSNFVLGRGIQEKREFSREKSMVERGQSIRVGNRKDRAESASRMKVEWGQRWVSPG